MKTIGTIEVYGHELHIKAAAYTGGSAAYLLESEEGEPWGTLSVNVPDTALEEGEFLAKTWGENEAMRAPALASGLFIDTGKRVPTGFTQAEVWKRTSVH